MTSRRGALSQERWQDMLLAWLPAAGLFLLSFAQLEPTPVQLAGYSQADLPRRAVAATIIAGLSAITLRFIKYHRWPFYSLALIGWLSYALAPAGIIASYNAAYHLSRRKMITFAVVALFAVWVPVATGVRRHPHLGGGLIIDGIMYLTLLVVLPAAYGLWTRSRNKVAEAEYEARAEQARSLERARIARELHDIVAHRVSLMVLHAGALEMAAQDERTAETADLIRNTGREALSELRQVLGILREPGPGTQPQPTLADLGRVIDRTRSMGVPIEFVTEGDAAPIPSTVERTAYRVVQESLTNVVKHAGAPQTLIKLNFLAHGLDVTVSNGPPTGPPHPHELPKGGLGLIGLRERVELLDGVFEAKQTAGGGFAVKAHLPTGGMT
ncbi:MAG TPA: histidine kinase [Candidatus Limnocylindrales bacterium]|nr:histidine kinase [Candidatus Limnocylindrales bacterium]